MAENIPQVTFSSVEEDFSNSLSPIESEKLDTNEKETFSDNLLPTNNSSKRPSSLVAIVRPIQARDRLNSDTSCTSGGGGNGSSSEDLLSLSRLPSPMERSGSLIPDLELPAPVEFMDRSLSPFWSDPGMCIVLKNFKFDRYRNTYKGLISSLSHSYLYFIFEFAN